MITAKIVNTVVLITADYRYHIFDCPPANGIKSADYLIRDVFDNEFVTNPTTIKDYGFWNCKNPNDMVNLLGLYIGLIKILKVQRDEFHDFCTKDKLGELIQKRFETHPVQLRGEYYPWFLKHIDIVKNGKTPKKLISKEYSFEDEKTPSIMATTQNTPITISTYKILDWFGM